MKTRISSNSFFGKLLRLPLRFIPKESAVPIIRGRMKGKKWVVGSGSHGFWLGHYEYEKQKLFETKIADGSVVYDLGGHVGFYTLLASDLVGVGGQVFVFEPLPRNLSFLRRHIQLNKLCNVTVIEVAVSDYNGFAKFQQKESATQGKLDVDGNIEVNVISLDVWFTQGDFPPPDFMKIDIEGAELQALNGAKKLLAEYQPAIFLATHGEEVAHECHAFLRTLQYELTPISHDEWFAISSTKQERLEE